jgi:ADP-ribosylglycohydrolase
MEEAGKMLGAIAGDIIGSVYEARPIKSKDFPLFHPACRFTDDSVLTVAVARAILDGTSYRDSVWELGRQYPNAGYGGSFIHWLDSPAKQPYNSWGNGSAMRVSPVGFAFDTVDEVLEEAEASAAITHDHPEGIKGAQAVALSVFLARTEKDKAGIKREVVRRFGYDLERSLDAIRPRYSFDVSCQGSVPESIIAFLESDSYEDAVRNAISLGGDADTQACIAGSIAEAYYGPLEPAIMTEVRARLTPDLLSIADRFAAAYGLGA